MAIEIWGGHECTVNRVGDVYRDQNRLTGHHDRIDDLDRFAALGLRRLRYPILWERTVANMPGDYDWTWIDERMARLRALDVDPIVGLLHHGSGPSFTELLADDFPALFADYAAAVAARYPWVTHWTPVNEPLTTARFSALYGLWYPHARDERSFWRALLNQIDATRLAMQAIRHVNPAAKLIQTDDLGRTYATPSAQGVADYYNDRRWMGWDLLCGRVTPGHRLWDELCALGFEARLSAIAAAPCPPDVIGINHYITSDRYLDDSPATEPLPDVGFHDRVAARSLIEAVDGLEVAIEECWARYGLPIAVTECHLSCTREDQLRWLSRAVETCERLAGGGVDVTALTVWALLGAVGWDELLTGSDGRYEAGAFDVGGREPRRTALGNLIESLAAGTAHRRDSITSGWGWWQRDVRRGMLPACDPSPSVRPILITGATGTLGRAFAGACAWRGLDHVLTDRRALAIDEAASVAAAFAKHDPWLVINAAGWVRVDDAEAQESECFRSNTTGPLVVAEEAARRGVPSVHFSSDLVFGGERDSPWSERDTPCPLNAYGRAKAAMEQQLLAHYPDALIVRTAAFFSPYDEHNFARAVERTLGAGETFRAAAAEVISPTYVPDLVNATLDLAIDGEPGIWHLTNGHPVSWEAFARMIARAMSLPEHLVEADFSTDRPARRPEYAVLGSSKSRVMPSLANAVARYAVERRQAAVL